MERETFDVLIEEEFILAKIFAPLVELEPMELAQELDQLLERKPRIPDIALYALIQIRTGTKQLLEELPSEKQSQKNRLVLLRAAFRTIMRNKVSSVLKGLQKSDL